MNYYNIESNIIADAKQQINQAKLQYSAYKQAYDDMVEEGLDVSFMVKPTDEYFLKLCSNLGLHI